MSETTPTLDRSSIDKILAEPGDCKVDTRLPQRVSSAVALGEAAGAILQIVEIPTRIILAGRHLVDPPFQERRRDAIWAEVSSIPSIANERMDSLGRKFGKLVNSNT